MYIFLIGMQLAHCCYCRTEHRRQIQVLGTMRAFFQAERDEVRVALWSHIYVVWRTPPPQPATRQGLNQSDPFEKQMESRWVYVVPFLVSGMNWDGRQQKQLGLVWCCHVHHGAIGCEPKLETQCQMRLLCVNSPILVWATRRCTGVWRPDAYDGTLGPLSSAQWATTKWESSRRPQETPLSLTFPRPNFQCSAGGKFVVFLFFFWILKSWQKKEKSLICFAAILHQKVQD